ncbi:Retrovirus-related Pol polyprotein from transposon TNT 1-94 [Dendrobium catenatum]|uniref:Retrovirus-related Pol polyprotein from transposon TNT 1-94 n=1 Tax=Dendrobium catenatum TaxID=906689 RepID=A0A2I0XJE0_9ASPA|nr:Retrovirus-related Pol polyprotein from transposon TNT 1-94 [Dendrobium catenatum]
MEASTLSQSHLEEQIASSASDAPILSSSLKFVLSNLKNTVQNPLSRDNYPLWRSQILKICKANGLESFLDPLRPIPEKSLLRSDRTTTPNPLYAQWILNDQNLAAAMCATISASILPYVLQLETTAEIWATLQTRFQSTNRSKVIQLKNELHHISLKNSTMVQYLNDIKSLVDQIAAAGARVDEEDIILYILNGLPSTYQAFKTSIRTMTQPLNLDQLYSFLISEEIHVASDAARSAPLDNSNTALFVNRGRGRRGRGRSQGTSQICQICLKKGHTATDCWHGLNVQYVPQTRQQPRALAADQSRASTEWYLDSGASSHLTHNLDNLSISNPYNGSDGVTIGDGRSVSISNSGKGLLPTPSRKLHLSKILHSPEIHYNLISISQLTRDNNIAVTFTPSGFVFKDLTTHQVIFQGPCRDGLYPIQPPQKSKNHALTVPNSNTTLWHNRLGHPSHRIFHSIASCNSQLHIDKKEFVCHACNKAKQHKAVLELSRNRAKSVLDLIHSDVWGPAPALSNSGMLYYVLFIDDYSRFTWLFPMRQKSEVFNIFVNFKSYIENFTSSKIKCLRTDGGGEFVSTSLSQFLKQHGILHQISCPYTPKQNGVAERKHRHVIETTRSLLDTASVPYKYWPDAVLTATYLINRIPSPNTDNVSPYELLNHKAPSYAHLRTFGSACFPLIPANARHKLQPKAQLCVFLGYSDNYKGYKCCDLHNNKIIFSRHVTFDENCFPFLNSSSNHNTENVQISPLFLTPTSVYQPGTSHTSHTPTPAPSSIIQQIPSTQAIVNPEASDQQTTTAPQFQKQQATHQMLTRSKIGSLKPTVRLNLIHHHQATNNPADPTTYAEANKSVEWRQAMAAEFLALQQQGTWDLVQPPSDATVLGCKWTYRTKLHSDGSVAKHKARLVAQGNHQEYGLDYTETFSPVAKLPTIRILLAIALHYDWTVQQLDVANAFLHGSLTETVYMHQPQGFKDTVHPNYVCRLHKAIYGLKQAPRQWYNTFTSFLTSIGFKHCQSDPSLLIFRTSNISIFLLIYVDDLLITGNSSVKIQDIINMLNTKFTMKHLGAANSFMGIQIKRTADIFFLSQKPYANFILQMAELHHCNPLSNPTCTKMPAVFSPDKILGEPITYRRIIGSLQYLCLTIPDIAYSVNYLS